MEPKRTIFYFDGFNFYNGLKAIAIKNPEWKKFYWIDFKKLCLQFTSPISAIEKIKYFTAAPLNKEKQIRWSALMGVNRALNPKIFNIIPGKYYKKPFDCPICQNTFKRPEEKRTDVNISVQLIADCVLNLTDALILISADSDIVPAIEFIKIYFPQKQLKVYFPPERFSKDIYNIVGSKNVRLLKKSKIKFNKAILPDQVCIGEKYYYIPSEWKSS